MYRAVQTRREVLPRLENHRAELQHQRELEKERQRELERQQQEEERKERERREEIERQQEDERRREAERICLEEENARAELKRKLVSILSYNATHSLVRVTDIIIMMEVTQFD